MRRTRKFDCVKMKNDIQARLAREWRGLTDDQIVERIRQELATGDDPVAQLWRASAECQGGPRKKAAPAASPRRRRKPARVGM